MGLLITEDMTHTRASEVAASSEMTYPYPCWCGQTTLVNFRIVNTTDEDLAVVVYAEGEHADRLLFSHRSSTDYRSSILMRARAQGMSDCIWVTLSLPNDAETESVETYVMLDSTPIRLSYEAFSSWDQRIDPRDRYSGETTAKIQAQFDGKGQVVTVFQYTPITDKRTISKTGVTLEDRRKADYSRWVDPADPEFWESPESDPYLAGVLKPKVFLGDRHIELPYPLNWPDNDLDYSDRMLILLPPDLFLERIYTPWVEDVSPYGPQLYQRSCYALLLDGFRYSIENVNAIWTHDGQFVYWQAEARLIFAPTGDSRSGWLPWNALYEEGGNRIVHYLNAVPDSVRHFGIQYQGDNA